MAKFAERIAYMQETSDVIRYLFKSMTNPETISFGGAALPSPKMRGACLR